MDKKLVGFKRLEGSVNVLGLNAKVLRWADLRTKLSHAAERDDGAKVLWTGEEVSPEEVKKLASQVGERHTLREDQMCEVYVDSLGFYKRRTWYLGFSLAFFLLSKVVVSYV